MKIEQRKKLFDMALKAYCINGPTDTATVITRENAMDAKPAVVAMKKELLTSFPREFTKVLREKTDYTATDLISILRQLSRYHDRRIVTRRASKTDNEAKKRTRIHLYNLL